MPPFFFFCLILCVLLTFQPGARAQLGGVPSANPATANLFFPNYDWNYKYYPVGQSQVTKDRSSRGSEVLQILNRPNGLFGLIATSLFSSPASIVLSQILGERTDIDVSIGIISVPTLVSLIFGSLQPAATAACGGGLGEIAIVGIRSYLPLVGDVTRGGALAADILFNRAAGKSFGARVNRFFGRSRSQEAVRALAEAYNKGLRNRARASRFQRRGDPADIFDFFLEQDVAVQEARTATFQWKSGIIQEKLAFDLDDGDAACPEVPLHETINAEVLEALGEIGQTKRDRANPNVRRDNAIARVNDNYVQNTYDPPAFSLAQQNGRLRSVLERIGEALNTFKKFAARLGGKIRTVANAIFGPVIAFVKFLFQSSERLEATIQSGCCSRVWTDVFTVIQWLDVTKKIVLAFRLLILPLVLHIGWPIDKAIYKNDPRPRSKTRIQNNQAANDVLLASVPLLSFTRGVNVGRRRRRLSEKRRRQLEQKVKVKKKIEAKFRAVADKLRGLTETPTYMNETVETITEEEFWEAYEGETKWSSRHKKERATAEAEEAAGGRRLSEKEEGFWDGFYDDGFDRYNWHREEGIHHHERRRRLQSSFGIDLSAFDEQDAKVANFSMNRDGVPCGQAIERTNRIGTNFMKMNYSIIQFINFVGLDGLLPNIQLALAGFKNFLGGLSGIFADLSKLKRIIDAIMNAIRGFLCPGNASRWCNFDILDEIIESICRAAGNGRECSELFADLIGNLIIPNVSLTFGLDLNLFDVRLFDDLALLIQTFIVDLNLDFKGYPELALSVDTCLKDGGLLNQDRTPAVRPDGLNNANFQFRPGFSVHFTKGTVEKLPSRNAFLQYDCSGRDNAFPVNRQLSYQVFRCEEVLQSFYRLPCGEASQSCTLTIDPNDVDVLRERCAGADAELDPTTSPELDELFQTLRIFNNPDDPDTNPFTADSVEREILTATYFCVDQNRLNELGPDLFDAAPEEISTFLNNLESGNLDTGPRHQNTEFVREAPRPAPQLRFVSFTDGFNLDLLCPGPNIQQDRSAIYVEFATTDSPGFRAALENPDLQDLSGPTPVFDETLQNRTSPIEECLLDKAWEVAERQSAQNFQLWREYCFRRLAFSRMS